MEGIRTVIWDCDNLMWFHKPEEPQILAKALQITDVEELSAEFFCMIEQFNKYFADKRVTLKETYNIIEKNMPILLAHDIMPEYFMKVWGKLKFDVNTFNEDTLVAMEYLEQKAIRNVIKTDWWEEVQIGMLKEFGVLNFIERLYCCDHSFLKCNPLSAKEIIKPGTESEHLIIGDTLTSDICFANHAGIKSIWFNRDGKQNDTPYKPTFEISSLLKIMDIL